MPTKSDKTPNAKTPTPTPKKPTAPSPASSKAPSTSKTARKRTSTRTPTRAKAAALDATVKTGVLAVVALGASLETAARYFKRDPREIVETLAADAEFRQDFKQAQEQAEVFYLKQLKTAALDAKNWRVATWSLERLYPGRYGRTKADAVAVDEIRTLFERLKEALAAEIPDSDAREKIAAKLDATLEALG